jgi:hypothetical protein
VALLVFTEVCPLYIVFLGRFYDDRRIVTPEEIHDKSSTPFSAIPCPEASRSSSPKLLQNRRITRVHFPYFNLHETTPGALLLFPPPCWFQTAQYTIYCAYKHNKYHI